MSSNGDIEIAVKAEGADSAAAGLAGGGGGGMGGGGDGDGDGGGGLRGSLKAGAIAGALMAAVGPLLDVLSPILKVLNAFLAPVALLLMRLFSPVLRFLLRLLPAWMDILTNPEEFLASALEFLAALPGRIWSFVKNLAPKIWSAFKSGASWLENGAVAIGRAVWKAIKSGAAWFARGATAIGRAVWYRVKGLADLIWTKVKQNASWITNGAVSIGQAVWNQTETTLGDLLSQLEALPREIWQFMKRLPGMIAKKLDPDLDLNPLATGGVATGPTKALIGEAGPEAVIPLDRLEQMMGQNDQTAISISGGLAPFVQEVERSSQVEL